MIPILVEEGYEWSIIANSHLARTCSNYLDVAQRGNSGWNIDPPNRADQLGPVVPSDQWWSGTLDGRGGAFPAPFAYQAHRAKHVDPATGIESSLIIVPMCDLLSYQNGFGTMGTGDIDAEITAGGLTNPTDDDADGYGIIEYVRAWNDVAGVLTADTSIDEVIAGGVVSATLNAPTIG